MRTPTEYLDLPTNDEYTKSMPFYYLKNLQLSNRPTENNKIILYKNPRTVYEMRLQTSLRTNRLTN